MAMINRSMLINESICLLIDLLINYIRLGRKKSKRASDTLGANQSIAKVTIACVFATNSGILRSKFRLPAGKSYSRRIACACDVKILNKPIFLRNQIFIFVINLFVLIDSRRTRLKIFKHGVI